MAITRPSGFPIVDDPVVVQEVAEIDGRGRLRLVPRWTDRIAWWDTELTESFGVLMVFVEPGLLSLRDWGTEGVQVVGRYSDLRGLQDSEALETLRLIVDRYHHLPIGSDRRPYLGEPALAHLGLPITRGIKSVVYVAAFPDRIDVFSPTYRETKLNLGASALDDLP
jgi:hypothetical protein